MTSLLAKINKILTLKCDEASHLTSESFDRRLLLHERLAVRLHVVGCHSCRQFARQLKLLHESFQRLATGAARDPDAGPAAMSAEFRERLRQQMRERS